MTRKYTVHHLSRYITSVQDATSCGISAMDSPERAIVDPSDAITCNACRSSESFKLAELRLHIEFDGNVTAYRDALWSVQFAKR